MLVYQSVYGLIWPEIWYVYVAPSIGSWNLHWFCGKYRMGPPAFSCLRSSAREKGVTPNPSGLKPHVSPRLGAYLGGLKIVSFSQVWWDKNVPLLPVCSTLRKVAGGFFCFPWCPFRNKESSLQTKGWGKQTGITIMVSQSGGTPTSSICIHLTIIL